VLALIQFELSPRARRCEKEGFDAIGAGTW